MKGDAEGGREELKKGGKSLRREGGAEGVREELKKGGKSLRREGELKEGGGRRS